jgi:MFS family permease
MLKDYYQVARSNKFIFLWLSQAFSQLSINILSFAFLINIYLQTNSTVATSFLWVVYILPMIIIGPVASAAVDILNKKKLLVLTTFSQALILLVYSFIHETSFFMMYAVTFTYSLLNQFYIPSILSALPAVVKREDLPFANGLFLLTQQGTLIIGFGAAGPILSLLGFFNTLFLCAMALVVASISGMFLPGKALAVHDNNIDKTFGLFIQQIIEGYSKIKREKKILYPFMLVILLQLTIAVIAVNSPHIATEIFKIPVNWAGVGLIIPAGIGALVGAGVVAKLMKKGFRKKRIINTSLLTFGLAFLFITVAEVNSILVLGLLTLSLVIVGAAYIGVLIPAQTFLQEKTPVDLRGRVFGNIWFISAVVSFIPVVVTGALTEVFGSRIITLILSTTFIGVYLILKNRKISFNNDNG